MTAVELAQVWVPLMPEASRLAGGVDKIAKNAEVRFGRAGKVMGSQVANSFNTASRKVVDSLRDIEKHTITVEKANKANADAIGRAKVAQERLNAVNANAKATELQRTTALENYNRAQRDATVKASALTRATNSLKTAQREQANAQKSLKSGGLSSVGLPMGNGVYAQAEGSGEETGRRFVTGFRRVLAPAAALVVGGGLLAGIRSVVTAGVDMESNLNRLQGVTSASKQEMLAASEAAQRLGSDTTIVGATAASAAAGMLELAKGGLTMQQVLAAAPGTLRLAAAAQIDAATAAESQAVILNSFQLGADKANTVADALANVANAAAGEVPDFMLGLQQASAVAHGFGISMEDTVATLGLFANAGIRGSDAGTSLKTMLTHLANPSDAASGAMMDLGLQVHNLATGEFVGLPELFRQVGEAANRMRPDDFQRAAATLFGTDAIRGAMIAGNQGIETLNKMRDAVGQVGGADRMAAANMQGLPGTLEKVGNAADGAKMALYELVKPMLEAGGNKMVPVIEDIADAITRLKTGGGGAAFTAISQGWRDISSAAMDLAPSAVAAVKALGIGAGGVMVTGWTALGGAIKLIEPPLRIIADLLGNNQWLSTGLMAGLALFIAKTKLLNQETGRLKGVDPVLRRVSSAWSDLRGPLRDVTDKTTGLVTQQGLFTRQAEGALGPLGRMRVAYLEGAKQAGEFGRQQKLSTDFARNLRTEMVQNLSPLGRMRQSAADAANGLRGMQGVMGAARAASSGLSTAASGLMGALGGPWGLAIMGATTLIGYLGAKHAEAAQAAADQKAAEEALQNTLSAGKATRETQEKIAESLEKSGASARAESFGLNPNLLLQGAMGDDQARAAVLDSVQSNLTKAAEGNSRINGMLGVLKRAGVDSTELSKALSKEGFNWDIVTQKLTAYNNEQAVGNPRFKSLLSNLDDLINALPDYAESAATMAQEMNHQSLTATQAAAAWERQNKTLNGTWELTEKGRAAFADLGVAVTSVPDDKTVTVETLSDQAEAKLKEIGVTVQHLPDGTVVLTANDDAAVKRWQEYLRKVADTPAVAKLTIEPPSKADLDAALAPINQLPSIGVRRAQGEITTHGGRASGGYVDRDGMIRGPGSGTSDSILAQVLGGRGGVVRVSNQESINTARSTRANWPVIDAMNKGANLAPWFRALPRYSEGGGFDDLIDAAESMVGTPYSQGARNDCSGSIAQLVNAALGDMGGGLMTTKNAAEWLSERGFRTGMGPAGSFRVGWYDHGPNPNDGHMAATLPDGRNAEAGGKNGVFTLGSGAAGAGDPQFDQHMYLPMDGMYGQGDGGGGGYGGGGSGSGSGPTRAERRTLRNAQQKIDDTAASVTAAQQHLDEVNAKGTATASQRTAAETRLAKAEREHQDALDDYEDKRQEIDEKVTDRASRGSGKSGSGGSFDPKTLGQDLFKGALEAVGFDGEIFGDPTQWGIWKLFTGGANYLGGLLKNAFGGPTEGGMWGPRGLYQGDPNSSRHGRGGGSPGPGNFGVNDGGLSGLNFADPGSAIGDTLSSILPNVRDFLPNSQTQTTPGGGNTYTTNHDSNNTSNTGAVINGNVTVNQQPGQPVRGNTYTLTLPAVGR